MRFSSKIPGSQMLPVKCAMNSTKPMNLTFHTCDEPSMRPNHSWRTTVPIAHCSLFSSGSCFPHSKDTRSLKARA